jgi:hypothetical protein
LISKSTGGAGKGELEAGGTAGACGVDGDRPTELTTAGVLDVTESGGVLEFKAMKDSSGTEGWAGP